MIDELVNKNKTDIAVLNAKLNLILWMNGMIGAGVLLPLILELLK